MKIGLDDFFMSGKSVDDLNRHIGINAVKVPPYPVVVKDDGHINPTAERVGRSIKYRDELYVKKVEVSSALGYTVLMDDGEIQPLKSEQMPSEIERACNVCKLASAQGAGGEKTKVLVHAKFKEAEAKVIMAARSFTDSSLPLTLVSRSPVLVKRKTGLEVITGYDFPTGIYAKGERPPEFAIDDAVQILRLPFDEFKFASPSDESRLYACLISSALVLPGILPFREPINFFQADDSQTGKGLLVKAKSAIYNATPSAVNQQKSGVGGIEESFDTALIYGQTFIYMDNLELKSGEIFMSPKICTFMTEELYMARKPYMSGVMINPRHHVVMATTNGCAMAIDLVNRCIPVRILHQASRKFRRYEEGGLVEHIRKNYSKYLGAIFAICREYYAAGMPRTDVTAHDSGFTPWFQSMDWIAQNIMNLPPLLEGYEKIKVGATSPDFIWLRQLCGIIRKFGKLGTELTASEIIDLMTTCGMELPTGIKWECRDSCTPDERKKVDMAFGRKMANCFKVFGGKEGESMSVDNFTVRRGIIHREYPGIEKSKELKAYIFTEEDPAWGSVNTENNKTVPNLAPEPIRTNREPMENQSEPTEPRTCQTEHVIDLNSQSNNNIVEGIGSIGSHGYFIGSESRSIGSSDTSIGSAISTGGFLLPRLILDLETYYDRDYSLSKLNYFEYIYDTRFKIHGIALRHPDGRTEFRTDVAEAVAELQATYGKALEKVCVVCHNSVFDLFILKAKFGVVPENIIDTMLCSRLLHNPQQSASLRELAKRYKLTDKGDLTFMAGVESPTPEQLSELAAYAINDVEITAQLAEIMVPRVEPAIEFWVMAHTIRMFVSRPFLVDSNIAGNALVKVDEHLDAELSAAGYNQSQLSGNKTFYDLLSTALAKSGRTVPTKEGKKGKIPAISGDDEPMQLLTQDSDPQVAKLAELRLLVKSIPNIKSKLEYLVSTSKLTGGCFPALLEYHKASTGRFAGGNGFNIQNMADSGKATSEVCRAAATGTGKSIKAPAGHSLVACDACQIEARILSFVAGEQDLHRAFAGGQDVYSEFVSNVFGEKVMKSKGTSPEELRMKALRNVGKTAILGLGYSMGADRFIASMKESQDGRNLFETGILNETICRRIVSSYRSKYPEIKKFWRKCEDAFISAAEGESCSPAKDLYFFPEGDTVYITLPSGRKLVYPCVRLSAPEKKTVEYTDESGEKRSFEAERRNISYGNNVNLYGGKITENIVQAIARDILVDVIFRLEQKSWPVILHIHDEIICHVPSDRAVECLDAMTAEWRRTPEWIEGLVLDAEGEIDESL